jgi:hypothetical protein
LKTALTTPPVLGLPNLHRPFILHTDASDVAIGAVLAQRDEQGDERVISYASRVLTAAERRYSTAERECLSIVEWTKYFRPYLYGQRFTVYTDHKAHQWLLSSDTQINSRISRWRLLLSEYDMEILHRPGKEHANADAMTRSPFVITVKRDHFDKEEHADKVDIRKQQLADPELADIIRFLECGLVPDDEKRAKWVVAMANQMDIIEGCLHHFWWPQDGVQRRDRSRVQLVVPPGLCVRKLWRVITMKF